MLTDEQMHQTVREMAAVAELIAKLDWAAMDETTRAILRMRLGYISHELVRITELTGIGK